MTTQVSHQAVPEQSEENRELLNGLRVRWNRLWELSAAGLSRALDQRA
jgi:hypothetical protein